jgi:hypothetical protein
LPQERIRRFRQRFGHGHDKVHGGPESIANTVEGTFGQSR